MEYVDFFVRKTPSYKYKSTTLYTCVYSRAGKNLRFFKKVFRVLGFLGFNVYAQSHAGHWTQEYDQLKSYTSRLTHPPVSTGIGPQSLPEWAFRGRPGLWRICLCSNVARIAEQKTQFIALL